MIIQFWIVVATIVAIIPAILIKKYTVTNNYKFLIYAGIFYGALMYSYIKIFSEESLGIVYTILQILQILLVVIFGILYYKEKLTTQKTIGIILGIISIYYLM